MAIPRSKVFSQSSLQDYLDCNYRFELGHARAVRCPAPEAEPLAEWETRARRGNAFHWMAQQMVAGVPVEALEPTGDEELAAWWARFKRDGMRGLPPNRFSEVTLSTSLAGVRLVAKLDLLAVEPGGRVVIVDYKTHKKQTPKTLKARIQTRVYRYVVAVAGAAFTGGAPIDPSQIEMRYWFAADARPSVTLDYSHAEFEADEAYLSGLISQILAQESFPKTDDLERCAFCTFRSLCERGQRAGAVEAQGEEGLAALPDSGDIEAFEF